ncbi:hypothetical protein [Flavobacterium pallidum]|uniref:hypothetical protein n=1 Tax=Flavobacterium pallidum TaxID=2172098 RepID=UPI0011B2227A|nr:hypothetical protein [Flavobacterium pallidum]
MSKNDNAVLQSACPGDGVCTIAQKQNKSVSVLEDEYGNLNYKLEDSPSKSVYIITYNRNVPKDVQDGTYREEIIFESENSNKSSVMEGEALQNARLLFGRFCYCKGQTGYYRINQGIIRVSGDDKKRVFSVDFTNPKTPQVLSSVKFTVRL